LIPVKLPTLLVVNTFVLLLSSLGIELARRSFAIKSRSRARHGCLGVSAGEKNRCPGWPLTLVLGLSFSSASGRPWRSSRELVLRVHHPSSSFVYLLTGAHAMHLMGGILALFVVQHRLSVSQGRGHAQYRG